MAIRKPCCLIEAGVTLMARSRNHVAWSKRETYICEFMWLVKSYSEASTAPLNVCTHSDMFRLSLGDSMHACPSALYTPLQLHSTILSIWFLGYHRSSAIGSGIPPPVRRPRPTFPPRRTRRSES